ncbi:hypothetical protein NQ314_009574 [Rhamnusium bicolor]|uniref:Myb-like domain-containing protein n=1 Tax=Rhamnusium bicolor TaxID=1586634 RepID=A0AAV8XYK0_9CUCU|nr:hypothetical protein NQ314_009574 [Rhamnusium bicolor]
MASRRNRIKGVANIPQRRKNNTNEEPTEPLVKIENENINLTYDSDKIAEETELQSQSHPNVVEQYNELNSCVSENNVYSKAYNGDISQNISVLHTSSNITTNCDINNKLSKENASDNAIKVQSNKNFEHEIENKTIVPQTVQQSKPLLMRRKFIKPVLSASVINRKPKHDANKESTVDVEVRREPLEIDINNKIPIENVNTESITILDKVIIPPKNIPNSALNKDVEYADIKPKQPVVTPVIKLNCGNEITLDETHLMPENEVIPKPEGPLDKGVKKLTPYTNYANNSDTEYPPPPPSPSKINRSRIKAIPRLSYRKTSFSASESEDESKRNYNRNRNDSICSTASGVPESIAECMSPQRPKESISIVQKKCNRTEQSRKLAEARREFQRRFGTSKPDRQRLTMIDLIFYNPTSNPMTNDIKSNQDKIEAAEENVVATQIDQESEKIDDPQEENEDMGKSDEENEMPVPQIKIGPSGEIILDEKSLVIESKEVKKQREELQKTQLVNGDFDTGYGIYKRQKRSKDWTHSETLRFYKALNTIGTDFCLMCELFPRRTRRELKMKFKKEERINQTLIDKAVMQPCSFDFTELKHEVDMEEKELEELQRQKEEEVKIKQEKNEEKLSRKRKAVKKHTIEENKKPIKTIQPKPPKIRKVRKPRIKKLNIENILENSDADESDIATQSESDDEISLPLKPTRSGRIPKVSKKFDHTESMSVENIIKRNKICDNTKSNNIEPGSIMIITEKGPNGEPVYKIFMVTPDNNATPLNLTSEVVSKAIEFKRGIAAQNILTISANITDDEGEHSRKLEENNITIPADENVTSLKGNNELCNKTIKPEKADENVTIPADENVTIPADEDVAMPADESVTILAHENVRLSTDENVRISTDENVTIPADENVAMLADKNVAISADENITVPADENVTVPSNENVTPIKSDYVLDTDATNPKKC